MDVQLEVLFTVRPIKFDFLIRVLEICIAKRYCIFHCIDWIYTDYISHTSVTTPDAESVCVFSRCSAS